jgi:hypothetical protein
MTVAELTRGVQFTVDQRGKITAVVIEPSLWERILAALEDAEDRALVQSLHDRLATGPAAAGALPWQDVADEWQQFQMWPVTLSGLAK